MSKLFVTGCSGFVGSRVFDVLRQRGDSLVVLDRSGSIQTRLGPKDSEVQVVRADLLEPNAWRAALENVDVVVHLAALTGRASEAEHFRVNAEGTKILVDECRRAGVGRLLFVSTIATKFPDKSRYYYAQAKAHAEDAVRSSGIRFTTIRPTIILGRGSPVLAGLEKLAGLPLIPVFGNGRARVQPIYVDDLIDFIVAILQNDRFNGETLELGGPVALTIEELLHDIRQVRRGARGHSVHVPLMLLLPVLVAAEKAGLGSLLPVSVGQLSSFRYDGTIESNGLYESRRAGLRDIAQMLALSFAA